MQVSIQEHDFDVAQELAALHHDNGQVGAVVSFIGLVREFSPDASTDSLYLEHFSGMSERVLEKIITVATQRWNLLNARVIHRIGHLQAKERIVLVATAARHRGDAFAACEYIIDYLKTDAPFWKKECGANGSTWLETKDSDLQRMTRWNAKTELPQGKST